MKNAVSKSGRNFITCILRHLRTLHAFDRPREGASGAKLVWFYRQDFPRKRIGGKA